MFLVCAAFIATAAGVVQAAPAAAPVAPSARIVLVDDTGAKVTLAGPARRIVSLSAGATELLFAAGAGDRIVATFQVGRASCISTRYADAGTPFGSIK
jgi:iron complex transport system substrate-binding protein